MIVMEGTLQIELACTGKFCAECFWRSFDTEACNLFRENRTYSEEDGDFLRLPACVGEIPKHTCEKCGCVWENENIFCPNPECSSKPTGD